MKNFFATAASLLVLGFAVPAMAVDSNNSNVLQNGDNQTAFVEQIGLDGATNYSTVHQGIYTPGGKNNFAKVEQSGSNGLINDSKIYQDGESHIAIVKQSGDGTGGDTNTSIVDQDGKNHFAKVIQGDTANSNYSYVKQDGTNHAAIVKQH